MLSASYHIKLWPQRGTQVLDSLSTLEVNVGPASSSSSTSSGLHGGQTLEEEGCSLAQGEGIRWVFTRSLLPCPGGESQQSAWLRPASSEQPPVDQTCPQAWRTKSRGRRAAWRGRQSLQPCPAP